MATPEVNAARGSTAGLDPKALRFHLMTAFELSHLRGLPGYRAGRSLDQVLHRARRAPQPVEASACLDVNADTVIVVARPALLHGLGILLPPLRVAVNVVVWRQ